MSHQVHFEVLGIAFRQLGNVTDGPKVFHEVPHHLRPHFFRRRFHVDAPAGEVL
ncbi:MAG: hypothetical protein SGJ19_00650 [Planctomycetia bacterium]|nr:hypothetical protein [Planctomycetia bacterium]